MAQVTAPARIAAAITASSQPRTPPGSPGTARNGPSGSCGDRLGRGDADGAGVEVGATCGVGAVQESVSSLAPLLPATTTGTTNPVGVVVIEPSSPISKNPGPVGAAVTPERDADNLALPGPISC